MNMEADQKRVDTDHWGIKRQPWDIVRSPGGTLWQPEETTPIQGDVIVARCSHRVACSPELERFLIPDWNKRGNLRPVLHDWTLVSPDLFSRQLAVCVVTGLPIRQGDTVRASRKCLPDGEPFVAHTVHFNVLTDEKFQAVASLDQVELVSAPPPVRVGDRVRCDCTMPSHCARPRQAHEANGVLVEAVENEPAGGTLCLQGSGVFVGWGWVVVQRALTKAAKTERRSIKVGDRVRCNCAFVSPCQRPAPAHMEGLLVKEVATAWMRAGEDGSTYSRDGWVVMEESRARSSLIAIREGDYVRCVHEGTGCSRPGWVHDTRGVRVRSLTEHQLELSCDGATLEYFGRRGWVIVERPLVVVPPRSQADVDIPTFICVGAQAAPFMPSWETVQASSGGALDRLLDQIGTSRIGSDSDEEVREQLLRYAWARSGAPAAAFLAALTRAARHRFAYQDWEREPACFGGPPYPFDFKDVQ